MTLGEIAKEAFDANIGRPGEVWDIMARAVSDEVLRRNGIEVLGEMTQSFTICMTFGGEDERVYARAMDGEARRDRR